MSGEDYRISNPSYVIYRFNKKMIKMELRIYTVILLLSISLMSCTDIKRKNEKLVNIKAENYNGTTFQKNI